MTGAQPFWRVLSDGVSVAVKVQPRSRRPGVHGAVPGADGPRLAIAVSAAPEDGRANRAVCSLLAKTLRVAPSAVEIASGAAAREKRLTVHGDPAVLGAILATL
jgi:hypothetical protein